MMQEELSDQKNRSSVSNLSIQCGKMYFCKQRNGLRWKRNFWFPRWNPRSNSEILSDRCEKTVQKWVIFRHDGNSTSWELLVKLYVFQIITPQPIVWRTLKSLGSNFCVVIKWRINVLIKWMSIYMSSKAFKMTWRGVHDA